MDKTRKEIGKLSEQEEKLKLEISCLKKQLEERSRFIAKLKMEVDDNKHLELENKGLNDRIETLREVQKALREKKHELSEKVEVLNKEKNKLSKEVKELREEQEKLYISLDKLQCKIKEVNKEKEDLRQVLSCSYSWQEFNEEMERCSSREKRMRESCSNELKRLEDLILEKSSEIEQLEKDLLREKEEKMSYVARITEYMLCKLEESIKRSKVIKNDDKTVILQEIPVMKSVLEEVVQDLRGKTSGKDSEYASLPDETSVPLHAGDPGYESEEDSGYNSRSSTPIKLPNSLLTESYERSQFNQSESICKTQQ
ncbi:MULTISPECIES: hypothetical protein [Wolbachia]|uniref:hypothetical protein n=1 Tax=Wolbachia TaxID=953 RepID=UPI001FEB0151|nr:MULTISPECIES: hypothetical protein [Wolbachia]